MNDKTQRIIPDPDCEFCHGEGTVYDSVDYGSTTVQMPSFCNCVEEQADEDSNIVLVLDFPDDPEELPPDPPYDHTGHDTLEEKHL